MHVTKRLDLPLLQTELDAASVAAPGLGTTGSLEAGDYTLWTFDAAGAWIDLPPEAGPVVDAHVAPPQAIDYAGDRAVDAVLRTTDDQPHEILRFPCEQLRLYQADLTISGVDAANFVSKIMEGRFTWKRTTGNALMVGITVVSDIHDTAAAAWQPNALAAGTDIVFTVKGAAGRTVDWLLVGRAGVYAPGGLAS